MIFKKIFVPIDFSAYSEEAVNYAAELALKFHSDLTLFHAIVMYQYDFTDKEKLTQYEEILREHADKVEDRLKKNSDAVADLGIKVETVVERGISAADCILDFIGKNSFDLVVMGTHGKTGLKHLLQGSVAEKIVRLAPIPVLTVHKKEREFNLEKVLAPVDFSESSQKALENIRKLREIHPFHITCLHVVEKMVYPAYYAGGVNSIFELDSDLKNRVINNMREVTKKIGLEGDVDYAVVEGIAHQEIVEYARREKFDLISISTRGLTGFEYALIGSTAEKVVRFASVPVLTFK